MIERIKYLTHTISVVTLQCFGKKKYDDFTFIEKCTSLEENTNIDKRNVLHPYFPLKYCNQIKK